MWFIQISTFLEKVEMNTVLKKFKVSIIVYEMCFSNGRHQSHC